MSIAEVIDLEEVVFEEEDHDTGERFLTHEEAASVMSTVAVTPNNNLEASQINYSAFQIPLIDATNLQLQLAQCEEFTELWNSINLNDAPVELEAHIHMIRRSAHISATNYQTLTGQIIPFHEVMNSKLEKSFTYLGSLNLVQQFANVNARLLLKALKGEDVLDLKIFVRETEGSTLQLAVRDLKHAYEAQRYLLQITRALDNTIVEFASRPLDTIRITDEDRQEILMQLEKLKLQINTKIDSIVSKMNLPVI